MAGASSDSLSLRVVGTALSVKLVMLYVGYFLSVLFLPMLPLSRSSLGLFTAAWRMSIAGLMQGVLMNVAIGWIAAVAYVLTYNWAKR